VGDPAALPSSLAAFHEWWLTEPALDDGQVRDRVPPCGAAGAPLMVIVAQPEAQDRDALLSGQEGRLLAGLLAAAGLDPGQVYFGSALPRHRPLPDWASLTARGLGQILAHHVALVAPHRLLVFGSSIPPLLGHDMAQNAQILPAIKHEGHSVPVLATRELGALLARPAWKAGLWRQWLDWTGSNTT
jgi:DNA polymerase